MMRSRLVFVLVLTVITWICAPLEHGSLARAADAVNIGVVDSQRVLEGTRQGKTAIAELDEYTRSRQQVLALDQKEIIDLQNSLSKQGSIISPEALQEREEELQRRLSRFQQRQMEMSREVQDKQFGLIRTFRDKLSVVVNDLAKKNGYSLVLNMDPQADLVLYAGPSYDLTDQVIKEMGQVAEE